MKISFIAVAVSHAAFAEGLPALLIGQPVVLISFLFSLIACAVLGPFSDRTQPHPETSIGILFSSTLGLASLFMGMPPEPENMLPLILSNGFEVRDVVDEPDFFLMKFKKFSAS